VADVRPPSGPPPHHTHGGADPSSRIVGLDVARCLALLGMMAVHVHDRLTAAGDLSLTYLVAGGRASALFAVLAGVSLALMSGGVAPVGGPQRRRLVLGLAVRAVLVAAVGMWLAGFGSGIAVILTYYGVLFLLGLPFLGLGARALAVLAVVWAVLAPVVSHLLRPALPARGYDSPGFGDLADPGRLAGELLFTGYYPVFSWLAFLLAGMAVGRCDLRAWRTQITLVAVGAALAVTSSLLSWWVLGRADVRDALFPSVPDLTRAEVLDLLDRASLGGTPPTGGGWQWLLVAVPHTATPADLAHSIGTSLCVIGVCLLVVRLLSEAGERGVAVLFGAGTMTLTLYTLHVVMRSPGYWPADSPDTLRWHVLVVMAIGAVFVALRRRGPLETIVGAPQRLLRRPPSGGRP
jgi:uncharacterized membrane protein